MTAMEVQQPDCGATAVRRHAFRAANAGSRPHHGRGTSENALETSCRRSMECALAGDQYAFQALLAACVAPIRTIARRRGIPPASLSDAQREAVQLLVIEQNSYAQAAEKTKRSAGALRVSLHRALQTLRRKTRLAA
jgi:hypothetical protein